MATKRTAIGRRLAVRRGSHGPPWGGWKAGHRSILAPLTATLAATLAVGVGVALAIAERERRTVRAQPADRRLGIAPGEPLGPALRRMLLAQIDVAVEQLGGETGGEVSEDAVHETRKALKRLRALLRMLRPRLGEKCFEREDRALAELGRRLAPARDAEVMLSTLDALIARHPRKLGRRRGVRELRTRLEREHERARRRLLADGVTRTEAAAELRGLRLRVLGWELSGSDGLELAGPGLSRIYRDGRRRYRRAERGRGNRVRAMHRWRKRVKDLRHSLEAIQLHELPAKGKRSARARSSAKQLRELSRRADRLAEALGEEHDLALLAELVTARRARGRRGKKGGLGRGSRKQLHRLIARRRRELRRQALSEGARLYRRKPRRFRREVTRAWRRQSVS